MRDRQVTEVSEIEFGAGNPSISVNSTVPFPTSQLVLHLVEKQSKLANGDFRRPDQKRIDTVFTAGHNGQHHADRILNERRDAKLFSNFPLLKLDRQRLEPVAFRLSPIW